MAILITGASELAIGMFYGAGCSIIGCGIGAFFDYSLNAAETPQKRRFIQCADAATGATLASGIAILASPCGLAVKASIFAVNTLHSTWQGSRSELNFQTARYKITDLLETSAMCTMVTVCTAIAFEVPIASVISLPLLFSGSFFAFKAGKASMRGAFMHA